MPLSKAATTTTTTTIGGGETRSQSEPTTRSKGDSWLELDGTNYPLYGWPWRWSGSSWLSPDFYFNYSFINLTNRFDSLIAVDGEFNYFFKRIKTNSLHNQLNNEAHYWEYWLILLTNSNGFAPIFKETTIGQTDTAIWHRKSSPINLPINIATSGTNQFNLITQPNGAPGYLYAGVQLVYNLSRL